jgi:hypothetical protein
MRTKNTVLPFLFLLILSTFSSVILVTAQSTTSLTVATNKQTTYNKYDPITISGTLKSGSLSPSDGLVGIQIDYPNSEGPMVLRTVQTGSTEVINLPEQITTAYSSNSGGSPASVAQNGNLGYFTASITDTDDQAHTGLLVISIYDGNGVPLGLVYTTMSIGAEATQSPTLSIPVPTTAHSGTAYGYADLYSGFPQNGGIPLAQEQSFQFTISGGTSSSGPAPTTVSATAGAYSLTFKLPKTCPDGAYTVYASASYANQDVTAQTGFNVLLIGDFDFAGVVNGNDLFIFAAAYINYYEGLPYNSLCDINNQGKVDATDFFLFVGAYIQYWSP